MLCLCGFEGDHFVRLSLWKLRKHRKNWPSWNKHSEIHFIVLLWTVIAQSSLSFLVLMLICFITCFARPQPPLRHGVPLTWGGRLCSLRHSTSRTVFSSPLMCLGSEVKETMLYFLCLVIFFLLNGSWDSINVIVIYLFYNGYLAKGFSLLYWISNESL